jgi:hypothetical protein
VSDGPATIDRRLERLVALFESVTEGGADYRPPNKQSLKVIREHFGVDLPPSLVELARSTRAFGSWFASLGDDYQDHWHIMRVNSRARRMRRRRNGRWSFVKPAHLLVINRGHDDDFDCIDLRTRDPETGECKVRYWSPDGDDVPVADTFHGYVEDLVREWRRLK